MHEKTMEGVALQLHAAETVASNAAALRLQQELFDLFSRKLSVTVTISGIEPAPHAERLFAQGLGLIAAALNVASASADLVSIAIDADVLTPHRSWMVRREVLGGGPLYLLVDSPYTQALSDAISRRRQQRFWVQCWQLRGNPDIRVAMAPFVSSRCALFAPEPAPALLPQLALQVPPGTAWASTRINLKDYCDQHGVVDLPGLHDCIRGSIDDAERIHDEGNWPTAAMRHDSWSNRRVALLIEGIGDLTRARGADSGSFATLQDLSEIMQDIRNTADEYSRRLAAEHEHAPSLRIMKDDGRESGIVEMAGWQARWQSALRHTATRHRNLLALSPWSLFPSDEIADSGFSDLLPLLAFADACAFGAPPCRRTWNVNEFIHFHRRLAAVLAQKDAQHMFAEQV